MTRDEAQTALRALRLMNGGKTSEALAVMIDLLAETYLEFALEDLANDNSSEAKAEELTHGPPPTRDNH